jgi:hypothetical protein
MASFQDRRGFPHRTAAGSSAEDPPAGSALARSTSRIGGDRLDVASGD